MSGAALRRLLRSKPSTEVSDLVDRIELPAKADAIDVALALLDVIEVDLRGAMARLKTETDDALELPANQSALEAAIDALEPAEQALVAEIRALAG